MPGIIWSSDISGESGLVSHAGVALGRVAVECADGGAGTRRETAGVRPADEAEPAVVSFRRAAIANVSTIANTAAIKVTATARGG